MQRWLWALMTPLCLGCAAPKTLPVTPSRPDVPVARANGDLAQAVHYSTEAAEGGLIGGVSAKNLETELMAELARRGDAAVADGRLAATASWILDGMVAGRPLEQSSSEAVARRNGFAGVVLSMAGFDLRSADRDFWRAAIGRVPANMPITRYGISVRSDRVAAVVFGNVEVSLAPFASQFSLHDSLDLRGEIGTRFAFARVFLTKPDGSVEQRVMPSRAVEARFSFAENGQYKLEVMGDGDTGPVVVANVPLSVGSVVPERARAVGRATTPAESEARLFELLNQSRAVARLPALIPDEALRDVAFAHSTDMAEHDFFGHVSPTTGDPEARLRRAGIVVSAYGENVAQADSPEDAHDSLMSSPGHRAVMLGAQFTHVGVSAVPSHSALVYTLLFARRAAPETTLHSAADLQAAFLTLRERKGLNQPIADDIYRIAAEAGLEAYAAAPAPSSEIAVTAMHAALVREVQRRHASRAGSCSFVGELIDSEQLAQNPVLLAPGMRRFGLAARPRAGGSALLVMMVLEGVPCG